MLTSKTPSDDFSHLGDGISLDLLKITRLSENRCFFCYKALDIGKYSLTIGKDVLFSCNLCIIRVALTELKISINERKNDELEQIEDTVKSIFRS